METNDRAFDFDLLAASIRADAADLAGFMEALAAKLTGALPGAVQIEREGGLFRRDHAVKAMRVNLDDRVYSLVRSGGGIESRVSHSVRGVTLKNDILALDAWIEARIAAVEGTK